MPEGRPTQSARFVPRTRPVVPPIHHSVTYFLDDEACKDVQEGGLDEIWYGRFRNPTVDVAADEVRRIEGAEAAFMTSSGMGAIAKAPTAVVYVETLANPQLDLADLTAIGGIAHAAGARLVVDNTFATPYCVQPLALGADVVVHSATKFLNGHSDAIAGVVAGSSDLVREVQCRVTTLGTCLDPHAAYLVWRGMQTFDVRMERSCATARSLAAALADRSDVVGVRHPLLPDYERAAVAARVLRRDEDGPRTGGMVSFTVDGGDERALQVIRHLQVCCEATSLGGVESLVSTPFNSSHFSLTREERVAARIDDGMIRVSCGVEPVDVLIGDFLQALDRAQ